MFRKVFHAVCFNLGHTSIREVVTNPKCLDGRIFKLGGVDSIIRGDIGFRLSLASNCIVLFLVVLVPENRENEVPIEAIKFLGCDVLVGCLLDLVLHDVVDGEGRIPVLVGEKRHCVICVVHGLEVVQMLGRAAWDVREILWRVPQPLYRREWPCFVAIGILSKLAEAGDLGRGLVRLGLVGDRADGEARGAPRLSVPISIRDLHDEVEAQLLRVILLEPSRLWICNQVLLDVLGPFGDDGVEQVVPVEFRTKLRSEPDELKIIPEFGMFWVIKRLIAP